MARQKPHKYPDKIVPPYQRKTDRPYRSVAPKCGQVTRGNDYVTGGPGDGHPCRKPAGFGTDHPGVGSCKFHGGAKPIKHGLFSKYVRKEYKANYDALVQRSKEDIEESRQDYLHMLDSVVVPMALKRKNNGPRFAGDTDPAELLMKVADVQSKVLKRQHDMEVQKKIAFTLDELRQYIQMICQAAAEFMSADGVKKFHKRVSLIDFSGTPQRDVSGDDQGAQAEA